MVWNALKAYEVEYKTTLIADSKDGKLSSQITVQDKVVNSNLQMKIDPAARQVQCRHERGYHSDFC